MRTSSETMPAGPEAPAAAERTPETLPTGPGISGRFYARVFEADPLRGFVSVRNGVALGLYLLFAVTFSHFGAGRPPQAWEELLVHHAEPGEEGTQSLLPRRLHPDDHSPTIHRIPPPANRPHA